MITAYNTTTKEKNVPVQNAVITKTKQGSYLVKGDDGKGNKLCTLVKKEVADRAVEAGEATKNYE